MIDNVIDWWDAEDIFYKAGCEDIKCPNLIADVCKTPCIGLFDDVPEETKKFTKLVNLLKEMPDDR